MDQSDINKLMDDKSPVKPDKGATKPGKIKSGKWPILSKFLKDVGHFVFNEDSASDELKKDLTVLESTRAEERAKAKALKQAEELKKQAEIAKAKEAKQAEELKKQAAIAKAKEAKQAEELKQAEERAKAKALKEKAEEERKKQAETAKQAKMAIEKAKKMSFKARLTSHFKKERESFDARQRTMAQHLLQTKAKQATPTPPSLKATSSVLGAPKFEWFKSKSGSAQLTTPAPRPAPLSGPVGASPTTPLFSHQISEPLAVVKDKNQATNKFKDERLAHQGQSQKEQIENRSWESFGVVHTNLIREHLGMFLNWQSKILWLLLFVAIAGLASIAAYGFLLILEKDKISSSQGAFANLTGIVTQIQSEEVYAEEILTFNNKLLAVDYLLNNHIYWTNFYKFLEDNTINDVYYEKFSGDLSGKYVLPTVAKDYRSISTQLRVLQSVSDKVLGVDTGGAESASKGTTPVTPANGGTGTTTPNANVKFDLNLNLNRSVFIKEPQYGE